MKFIVAIEDVVHGGSCSMEQKDDKTIWVDTFNELGKSRVDINKMHEALQKLTEAVKEK